MPTYETLICREEAGVATLTLNRPGRRNAIDLTMRRELTEAVHYLDREPSVRAVVLTGAGGNFCSGGDVASMRAQQPTAEQGRERVAVVAAFGRALLELQKPVIAAVDGTAYGGGFSLALCADLLVATPEARFCFSFMRVGLIPDLFSTYTLPRIVGLQRARQLIYSASEISGEQALSYGIVSELVAPESLATRCEELARAMTELPPTAFGMTKHALLRSFNTDLGAAADAECLMQGLAFSTDYHREATGLLLDKKPLRYAFPRAGS